MDSDRPASPQKRGSEDGFMKASGSRFSQVDDECAVEVLHFNFGSTGITTEPNDSVKCGRWLSRFKPYTWGLPMIYGYFCITLVFSIFPPFFPAEASSKGLHAWQYGFVFSAYEITMLLGSFVTPKLLDLTSARTCYLVALGVYFLFTIFMGSVYWIADGTALLGICIFLFAVGGFTEIVLTVVLLAGITNHFKEKSGVMISFIELIWEAASLIGASLGGILIDWWAYPLPFYVFSATLVLAFLFIVKFRFQDDLPNESSNATNTEENLSTNCWKLLLDLLFLPDLVTIMMCWAITGFNETTLEPSLRTFGLSHTEIGNMFVVQYASSMIGSVVAGISCHFQVEAFFCFVGQIFAALAYLVVGPAPFIPYERALWMVYLAQAFIGLAMTLMFACAYTHALKVVTLRGCPDTIQTKGFVSSSVMVAMMIGGLVTPPLAGYIVDQVGYRTGTMALFGLFAAWIPVTFALWVNSLYWPGKHKASSVKSHSRVPAEADA